jgi:hypothetical protein
VKVWLASPTGFEPVVLQNGPLIPNNLGHAKHWFKPSKPPVLRCFAAKFPGKESRPLQRWQDRRAGSPDLNCSRLEAGMNRAPYPSKRKTSIEHFGIPKASPRYPSLVFQQPFPLLGLSCCGRAFEFDDQLLELRVGVKTLQIDVGHQGIGVFISAI